ncbi:hypothetical protein VTK56DRAFT_2341 [Thermocarpiscus australiensis]
MSTTSPQSPPKRPRLSLQIKALANGPSVRTSRCLAAAVDVKSPTAFNTLSNVYATAVDRSTPVQENPPTAILAGKPVLRLQTQSVTGKDRRTPAPYLGPYLDTPLSSQPMSPAVAKEICFPSAAMTATPPLSAQPQEQSGAQVFTFDAKDTGVRQPAATTQSSKRRTTMPTGTSKLPYTHPRTLRSILRNSPLPPLSTRSPDSPRRQSRRLQEKAARRVAYNSPLEQTITTSKYTKSHIDLLAEDATPVSPTPTSSDDGDSAFDQAMADMSSQTRDGGQTPGPFEEMRRRMANMHASSPAPVALSPTGGGIRKRGGKRKEKKRRWVWTIGQDDDADEAESPAPAAAAAAPSVSVPVLAIPAPKPRTRSQKQAQAQAELEKAAAAAVQVPLLAVPVPPVRAADAQAAAPAGDPTRIPPKDAHDCYAGHGSSSSSSSSTNLQHRHLTPDPTSSTTMSTSMSPGAIEPPTPSVASTVSAGSSRHSRDSVFETSPSAAAARDVEMSDASSLVSDEDHQAERKAEYGWNVACDDGDVEMDERTPTLTARPVSDKEGEIVIGWAPWRDTGAGFVS